MLEKILMYIEAPENYWVGVSLYDETGESSFLKTLFHLGPDDYNWNKLVDELKKISEQLSKTSEDKKADYPELLKASIEAAKTLMDERADIKARLRMSWRQGDDANRRTKLALRVLEIKDELDKIYMQERYFDSFKSLPADDFETDDEVGDLMKRRATVRTYLTKYKNRPEKLKQYEEELFGIESKLKLLNVAI